MAIDNSVTTLISSEGSNLKPISWSPETIRVSIVIPCFNNATLTTTCLTKLNENTDQNLYEIILVDDASTDATKLIESSDDSWIRVIHNPQNLGFGPSCNRGAEIARGEIIIFLNNDAFVMANWLRPLLAALDEDDHLGAVQPKLLFPNGVVNDAGGLVFAEGKAWNYGKGQVIVDAPYINARRSPDYLSGACLAVRKSAFDQVEGFDPRYAPAYYEDTDLSFSLRANGWKLLYEPRSTVVHVEGATAGTDIAKGIKQYQVVNEQKFKDKWSDELDKRPYLDIAIVDRWALRPAGQAELPGNYRIDRFETLRNILVVDMFAPLFDKSAGGKRMLALLRGLRELGHSVSFLSNTGIEKKYVEALSDLGIPALGGDPNNPHFRDNTYFATHRSSLQKLLVNGGYDTVILTPWENAEPLISSIRGTAPYAKVVLDTCDIHFLRLEREDQLNGGPTEITAKLKERELNVCRNSDAVICITQTDKEAITEFIDPSKIHLVPLCHELEDPGPGFREREGILFIGNFLHPPNIDSVRWWKSSVLPLLDITNRNHNLQIIGNDPHGLAKDEATIGMDVIGTVGNLAPYYHQAKIAIAPLRYGAGMKGKVAEALSYGTPLIASPIAVEGFDLVHKKNVMIAETPREFREAIDELSTNESLWTELREQGRQAADEKVGPEHMRNQIDAFMKSLWA